MVSIRRRGHSGRQSREVCGNRCRKAVFKNSHTHQAESVANQWLCVLHRYALEGSPQGAGLCPEAISPPHYFVLRCALVRRAQFSVEVRPLIFLAASLVFYLIAI